MKKYSLDNNQISDLLNNYRLKIKSNEIIEIFEDTLLLNCKNVSYRLTSMILNFEKDEYLEYQDKINMLQSYVCEYFNLDLEDVICTSCVDEVIFRIRLIPKVELSLIVLDINSAWINAASLSDEQLRIYDNPLQIGPYRRLGNSYYYFRWLPNE